MEKAKTIVDGQRGRQKTQGWGKGSPLLAEASSGVDGTLGEHVFLLVFSWSISIF